MVCFGTTEAFDLLLDLNDVDMSVDRHIHELDRQSLLAVELTKQGRKRYFGEEILLFCRVPKRLERHLNGYL